MKKHKTRIMKHLFLILALIFSGALFAQEDTPATPETPKETEVAGDTTIVRLGKHRLKIVEREGKDEMLFEKMDEDDDRWHMDEYFGGGDDDDDDEPSEWEKKHKLTHWSGVYVGINGYIGDNQSLDLPENANQMEIDYSKSFSFAINFPEVKIRLIKDYFGIYTGLGYQYNSFRLRQNVSMGVGDSIALAVDTVRNFTRNTIQVGYIRVPLMLEFNTSTDPGKSFHVAAGVVGGFRLHSSYVQRYDQQGVNYNISTGNIPNLNLFTGEAMLRVGYGPLVLYASYGLTPLFDTSEGPELYPFTAGLGFSF